jgi:hypothetical protein
MIAWQFTNPIDRDLVKWPTGFVEPGNITRTYDPVARTITLTGDVRCLWRGAMIPQLISGWVSPAHPATLDQKYFLYFDGSDFVWSTTAWSFDKAMIAIANYGTTHKFAISETHGTEMSNASHQEFHETQGTYRASGGDLSGYTLASTTATNRRPLVSSALIKDEDNPTILPAITTEIYSTLSLSGASGASVYGIDVADIVPLSGNNPYYNQFTGGAWQQTLLPTNQYMCVWLLCVPVTSDTGSQKYRFLWVQGQSQGTLASQQALTTQAVNLGAFGVAQEEMVFIQKVIIRYSGGNWTWIETTPLTGTRVSQIGAPSGFFLSSVSTDATLTGNGTAGNPLGISGLDQSGETIANLKDTFLDSLYFG